MNRRDEAPHSRKGAPRRNRSTYSSNTTTGFAGRFRITELDGFDDDYLCLVADPFIEFGPKGEGRFQIGALEATMDVQETERDSEPSIEFTWEGFDEGDEISGRGWAVVDADRMHGHLYFHLGDDYGFKAKRIEK